MSPPPMAYMSRIVWAGHIKLYEHIHTAQLHICTSYDVTNYFWWSEVASKNRRKCRRLVQFEVEFHEKGLSEDYQILHGCGGQLSHKPAG